MDPTKNALRAASQLYVGIDPGCRGSATAVNVSGEVVDSIRFDQTTEFEVVNWMQRLQAAPNSIVHAVLEQVHSMPKQGVASTFKFGQEYGKMIGILSAMRIPFSLVTPQRWQKAMNCMTKGDKKVTLRRAQQLWPAEKWSNATADSALIAEYCRARILRGQ